MAGYVEQLLDNEGTRKTMGDMAKEAFEHNFTVNLMAQRYEQLYKKILSR